MLRPGPEVQDSYPARPAGTMQVRVMVVRFVYRCKFLNLRHFPCWSSTRQIRPSVLLRTVRSYVAGHIRSLLWRRALCGARDTFLARDARERSPTPHNSYQMVRRNCISATSSFQCFGGTASRTSQVASAFAFISRSTSA